MYASLSRGNLRFTAIIMVALILLLLIPGIALGQDEDPVVEVPEVLDVNVQINEEGSGFFEGNTIWILAILLIVVVILLVFLVGRSGSRGGA